jgi:hypothetical protein
MCKESDINKSTINNDILSGKVSIQGARQEEHYSEISSGSAKRPMGTLRGKIFHFFFCQYTFRKFGQYETG